MAQVMCQPASSFRNELPPVRAAEDQNARRWWPQVTSRSVWQLLSEPLFNFYRPVADL